MTRLAFIGGGNMARSLIGGLLKTGVGPDTISVAEPRAEGRQALGRDFGVACYPENRLALIGSGATGLCANCRVSPAQKAQAQHILDAAGLTRWIDDEALMDTVTAISGSAPAYFFALVEALEEAGVAQGLPRDTARALAAQTCFGAGRMLTEGGEDPAVLRQRVTSPHGTTQAALESFGADGLPRMVARAVAAATRRGAELAAELDKQP